VSRLIVNADDFGLTAGVNRAIEELHRAGVLTSATLMAHAAATEGAIELACCTPTLSVGCHVVLVDGEPVLSPRNDIPHLADPIDGCFRSTLGSFLSWLYGFERGSFYSQKTCACEIEAETAVQIALLRSRGLRLTHIDTHKHVHMFPAVLRPVLRAAKAAGIRAVRNPFEPAWSLRATPKAPWIRRAEVRLLRMLEPSFRRIVAEEGFTTTDGAIGVNTRCRCGQVTAFRAAGGNIRARHASGLQRRRPRPGSHPPAGFARDGKERPSIFATIHCHRAHLLRGFTADSYA
jgi:predicted glycoside hydrolase/deacetylase ChbG (UPF0249 family)